MVNLHSRGGDNLIILPPDDGDRPLVAAGVVPHTQVEVALDGRLDNASQQGRHGALRQGQHVVERGVQHQPLYLGPRKKENLFKNIL